MSVKLEVKWDKSKAMVLEKGKVAGAIKRALRKAGKTAMRDMRAEASKRIRARKRLKAKYVNEAMSLHATVKGDIDDMEFRLDVSGKPVPLAAYPHRQTKKGVSVEVNKGKRTLLPHAFVAQMASGHEGIFQRVSKHRLPIHELLGSRPVDALLHKGEAAAVAERGGKSLTETFDRLLPLELEKAKGGD